MRPPYNPQATLSWRVLRSASRISVIDRHRAVVADWPISGPAGPQALEDTLRLARYLCRCANLSVYLDEVARRSRGFVQDAPQSQERDLLLRIFEQLDEVRKANPY